jgi:hypothetical protein
MTSDSRHRFQNVLADFIGNRLQLLRSEAAQVRWRIDRL